MLKHWFLFLLAICVGGAHAQAVNSIVLNQLYSDGCSSPHTYLLATLPASNDGTADHLHMVATLGGNWLSNENSTIDATFGNRQWFSYVYTALGASPTGSQSHITAYQQNDGTGDPNNPYNGGSINLYLMINGCTTASYTVLENMQETVYSSPADTGATTPGGNLVFDTASASYLPKSYISFNGNVGIGTIAPGAMLDVAGSVRISGTGASLTFPDGTVQSTAYVGTTCPTGGDYAESVDVTGDKHEYEPGDVMVIDPSNPGHFLKSSEPYSTLVAGIYSTKPGLVGRRQTTDPQTSTSEIPMAMVGIVPTKVSTENGPIKVGDLLVTSSTLGYVMKGTDRSAMTGAVVGKALGKLDVGVGMIEVLVSLQ